MECKDIYGGTMPQTRPLTPKQERFAIGCATLSLSDAYREAYNCENMTNEAIHANAGKLFKDTRVALRYEQEKARIQRELQKISDVTVDNLIKELNEALELAKVRGQATAAVSAIMAKAKLAGLLVEQSIDLTPTRDSEDERPTVPKVSPRQVLEAL